MAGVLLPEDATKLFTALKKNTKLKLELHSHCTGGICEMTYMAAVKAGCDIVDTSLSPLSGGTGQPSTQAFNSALKGTDLAPNLNEDSLHECEPIMDKVVSKYLASGTLNPKALTTNPNILTYQVPGGMLSNLMSQLKGQNAMDRYDEVLKEVPRVRKEMGYPPLVTPLSQMVGTQAVLNVLMGRYKMVAKEIKDYLHGKYGKAPAPVDENIFKQIVGDDEVITCRPADLLEPEFESLKEKYAEIAKCDEDVLSLALFENVATEFLKNKYSTSKDEVEEFNLFI